LSQVKVKVKVTLEPKSTLSKVRVKVTHELMSPMSQVKVKVKFTLEPISPMSQVKVKVTIEIQVSGSNLFDNFVYVYTLYIYKL